jgi:hypothetical protein
MMSTGMIPVALPQEPLDSGTGFVNSELILEMIEGFVEGVGRGDMQIPLPSFAIVVGNAIHYKQLSRHSSGIG